MSNYILKIHPIILVLYIVFALLAFLVGVRIFAVLVQSCITLDDVEILCQILF